jgi:UDP-glucose 4-epimerase
LDEKDELRGNAEFAYSDHKRQVEEMLAAWRQEHPELEQLIFRPGTILGSTTSNQITALFEKPYVLGLRRASIPFVFIWDKDVVGAIIKGIHEGGHGIYNMAGDGALTMREIAAMMHKPYIPVPVSLITAALWALKRLGLTQYGPEQVNFLRYRRSGNRRLKEDRIYRKTTRRLRILLETQKAALTDFEARRSNNRAAGGIGAAFAHFGEAGSRLGLLT